MMGGPLCWLISVLGFGFIVTSVLLARDQRQWNLIMARSNGDPFYFGYIYSAFVMAVGLFLAIGPLI